MLIEGVYTAVVTPFTESDTIDGDALEALTRHIVEGGGEGLVALGTTGDGFAVDRAERAEALRIVRDAADGRAGLVAGATAGTTREVIANVELARDLGYQAAMVAPPPYVLPGPSELAAHYREIARAAQLPILLYDYPDRTGVQIDWDVLDALVDVPEIVGSKEASGDMSRVVELRSRYGDRYELICGADSLAVDFALWGARGWIAGASGFLPREHSEVLALAVGGDLAGARRALEPMLGMLLDMERGSYGHKVRAGLTAHGLPAGRPRSPVRPLDDAAQAAFLATLATGVPR